MLIRNVVIVLLVFALVSLQGQDKLKGALGAKNLMFFLLLEKIYMKQGKHHRREVIMRGIGRIKDTFV